MDWQPIETAPKDGTDVLLHFPQFKGPVIGHFVDTKEIRYGEVVSETKEWAYPGQWMGALYPNTPDIKPLPSHWMPLPTMIQAEV